MPCDLTYTSIVPEETAGRQNKSNQLVGRRSIVAWLACHLGIVKFSDGLMSLFTAGLLTRLSLGCPRAGQRNGVEHSKDA
jgi:hypothetical protein